MPDPIKSHLRERFRRARRQLPDRERSQANAQLLQQLLLQLEQLEPATVAFFLPFDGEPDLVPGIEPMQALGIQLALPWIDQSAGGLLGFQSWTPGDPLTEGPFGIEQPTEGLPLARQQLDLMLMPLVAYDMNGNRLGMGAGYYDRYLAGLGSNNRPMRVGVAYSCQQADNIPADSWDIGLHAVLNESGWFTCPA